MLYPAASLYPEAWLERHSAAYCMVLTRFVKAQPEFAPPPQFPVSQACSSARFGSGAFQGLVDIPSS